MQFLSARGRFSILVGFAISLKARCLFASYKYRVRAYPTTAATLPIFPSASSFLSCRSQWLSKLNLDAPTENKLLPRNACSARFPISILYDFTIDLSGLESVKLEAIRTRLFAQVALRQVRLTVRMMNDLQRDYDTSYVIDTQIT
jgi:hypothetical protein